MGIAECDRYIYRSKLRPILDYESDNDNIFNFLQNLRFSLRKFHAFDTLAAILRFTD